MAFPTSYSSPYNVVTGGTALADDVNQYNAIGVNLETTVGITSGTASPSGTHEQRLKYLELGAGTAAGTPALTLGTANAAGTANTRVRTDATIAVFGTATPAELIIGGTASVGTVALASRLDHKHAMPAFATPGFTLGTANATGAAATLVRSDATLALFSPTAVPGTVLWGGPGTAGAAALAARVDHHHAQRAFGSIVAGTTSSPTTSSGVLAVIPEMSIPITTRGGDVEAYFNASFSNNVNGAVTGLSIGFGTAGTVSLQNVNAPGASYNFPIAGFYRWKNIPAATVGTVSALWNVGSGTTTAVTTLRYLIVKEVPVNG